MDVAQWAGYGVKFVGLGLIVCFGIATLAPAVQAATQSEVTQIIADEAARNGHVPLPMALAVAKVESDMRDAALSSAGARGVMQIMPATAMSEFGVPASALGDPRLNVRLGIAYLERLHNRYGGDWQLALSHYNGGTLPVTAGHYVAHDYTRQYVADVMKWAEVYRNDTTLMAALTTPGGLPPVQFASAGSTVTPITGDPSPADPGTVTPLADPKPQMAAAETAPIPAERQAVATAVADDTTYPSAGELRQRFRASLDRQREASVQAGDAGSAAAAPRGRFTYAPYGGG